MLPSTHMEYQKKKQIFEQKTQTPSCMYNIGIDNTSLRCAVSVLLPSIQVESKLLLSLTRHMGTRTNLRFVEGQDTIFY